MDVGDDRHPACAHDLPKRGGAFLVGAAHADDVDAGVLAAADLVDRRRRVRGRRVGHRLDGDRKSEEHTSELQSLMRISYAVFCLKKKTTETKTSTLKKIPK